MAKTTPLGVVTFDSAVRLSHLPDTLVYLRLWLTTSRICLKSNTGATACATGAITGVLFGLTIAVVL